MNRLTSHRSTLTHLLSFALQRSPNSHLTEPIIDSSSGSFRSHKEVYRTFLRSLARPLVYRSLRSQNETISLHPCTPSYIQNSYLGCSSSPFALLFQSALSLCSLHSENHFFNPFPSNHLLQTLFLSSCHTLSHVGITLHFTCTVNSFYTQSLVPYISFNFHQNDYHSSICLNDLKIKC